MTKEQYVRNWPVDRVAAFWAPTVFRRRPANVPVVSEAAIWNGRGGSAASYRVAVEVRGSAASLGPFLS